MPIAIIPIAIIPNVLVLNIKPFSSSSPRVLSNLSWKNTYNVFPITNFTILPSRLGFCKSGWNKFFNPNPASNAGPSGLYSIITVPNINKFNPV